MQKLLLRHSKRDLATDGERRTVHRGVSTRFPARKRGQWTVAELMILSNVMMGRTRMISMFDAMHEHSTMRCYD